MSPALEATTPGTPLGDRFDAIFRAELPYVLASLRRLGARPADLEDLAHDVFVVVHRRLGDYDPGRPVRPWLFGIAMRVASDDRRLSRRRHERADEGETDAAVAPGVEPERAALAEEKRALVLRGLASLDEDKRTILILHDIDGESMPEIAHALGVPLNTAYSRLRLARERFRQVIRSAEGGTS